MENKQFTEGEMALALSKHFDRYKNTVVPNTVRFFRCEADLAVKYPSGWCSEVEIKVSKADLLKEFKSDSKAEKHKELIEGVRTRKYNKNTRAWEEGVQKHLVSKYWVAVPEELVELALQVVPEYAGVICVRAVNKVKNICIEKRKAKKLKMSRKATHEETIQLLWYAHHRFWSQRENGGGGRR
jgi:hypothetical protein